jgi:hypothetical protein
MPRVSCISGCKKHLKSNVVPLYILGKAGSGGVQFGPTYRVIIVPQLMQEIVTQIKSPKNQGFFLVEIKSITVTITVLLRTIARHIQVVMCNHYLPGPCHINREVVLTRVLTCILHFTRDPHRRRSTYENGANELSTPLNFSVCNLQLNARAQGLRESGVPWSELVARTVCRQQIHVSSVAILARRVNSIAFGSVWLSEPSGISPAGT